MAGLDKIISQVKEESQEAAVRTIAATRNEVDQILAAACKEAERERVDIDRRSRQPVANILERGQSVADLRERGSVLAEKQRLIGETITGAKAELKDMDTDAYFEMILKLMVKPARAGKGELLLSDKDLARMPQGFGGKLNAALTDKGVALCISNATRDIDGEFVLAYEGIEENCSTNALFDSTHETSQDKVQGTLFS